MLATQRMSSHGGQLPFGYNQNAIERIGLPDFMNPPGPPHGQPILNDEENNGLNHFLVGFDSNQPHHNMHHELPPNQAGHMQYGQLPPVYFGSETSGGHGHGPGIEPHNLTMGGHFLPIGDTMQIHGLPMNGQNAFNQNMHGYIENNGYPNPLLDQLQTAAASVQQPQPGFTHNWNQQPYQPQGYPLQTPGRGPPMRFGSDSHFTQSGFQPPHDYTEPNDQSLDWLESAPNTQPNTEPNTQPSSPNWSKKRKLDDYQSERRNGYHLPNGHILQPPPPNSNSRRQRSSHQIKSENGQSSQPPTPLTDSKPQSLIDDEGSDDAAAESDDDPSTLPTANATRSPSPPAPWPSSKARPPKSNKPPPPPKPSRKRKKSTTVATPAKPKPPAKPTRTPSSRVPLSSEQKKANHTNSEQRRRDATARAFADLYDLVPEVTNMGKQSTIKKLELVVDKVRDTMKAVESLRGKLGILAGGSVAAIAASQGLSFTTMAQLGGHQYPIPTGMDGEVLDDDDDDDGDVDDDVEDALDPELA